MKTEKTAGWIGIPCYSVKHYVDDPHDGQRLRDLTDKLLEECDDWDSDVMRGLKFPGFHHRNEKYMQYYRENLKDLFCPPRGNLGGKFAVVGFAPGYSKYSEEVQESMWLLGPSSHWLHELLRSNNIYPYFTDLFKKPFPDNCPNYTVEDLEEAYRSLIKELDLMDAKTVIFIGQEYGEFATVGMHLDSRGIKHFTINHPRWVTPGRFAAWNAQLVAGLKGVDSQASNSKRGVLWHSSYIVLRGQGHGIELHYNPDGPDGDPTKTLVVAYIDTDHGWPVQIVRPISERCAERDLDGVELVKRAKQIEILKKAKRILTRLVSERHFPPEGERWHGYWHEQGGIDGFWLWLNG